MTKREHKKELLVKFFGSAMIFSLMFLLSYSIFSYLFTNHIPVENSSASEFQTTVNVDNIISIHTDKEIVNLDVIPTATGTFVDADLEVSVSTNNKTGYTLSMSTKTEETALTTNGDILSVPSIAESTSASHFPLDRWGYSIEEGTYNAIPAVSNPDTIKITDSQTDTSTANITFGAKVSTSTVADTYRNTVVFSAVANYVDTREKVYFYSTTGYENEELKMEAGFSVVDNDGKNVDYDDIVAKAYSLGLLTRYDIPFYNAEKEAARPPYINCFDGFQTCILPVNTFTEPTLITNKGGIDCKHEDQVEGNSIPMPFCNNYELNVYCYIEWTGWLDSGKATSSGDVESIDKVCGNLNMVWIGRDGISDNVQALTISGRISMSTYRDKALATAQNINLTLYTLSYTNFVKTIEAMGYTKANFTNGPCADGNC